MAPEKAAGEDLSLRRKRLTYRASHRGTRELDMLLGGYAASKVAEWGAAELDLFERLLEEEETELQQWLLGQATPPPSEKPLIDSIVAFAISRK